MKQTKGKIERNRTIVTRILNGENMSDLAKEYKISAPRVRSILIETLARIHGLRTGTFRGYPLSSYRAAKNFILNRL